jgi:2-iminobutanoate/2-iminopropanoate deaminase
MRKTINFMGLLCVLNGFFEYNLFKKLPSYLNNAFVYLSKYYKTMKQIIFTDKAPAAIGPYSQAVLAGNTLYVSGQIALDLAANGDIHAETNRIMQNIGNILAEAGMDYQNIVKSSIFLKDMNDFGTVNEVYGSYFTSAPPARETVQVARLPKDVNVEISVIAVKF